VSVLAVQEGFGGALSVHGRTELMDLGHRGHHVRVCSFRPTTEQMWRVTGEPDEVTGDEFDRLVDRTGAHPSGNDVEMMQGAGRMWVDHMGLSPARSSLSSSVRTYPEP
jgi:hypothetical protein